MNKIVKIDLFIYFNKKFEKKNMKYLVIDLVCSIWRFNREYC